LAVLCVDASQGVERTVADVAARGGRAAACVLDITELDAPERIGSAAGELGRTSVLVNNAGITRDGRVGDLDPGDFRAVVAVNLVAPLRLAEALATEMEPGGAVVNIASRAALGNFGQANYVAAKAGLIGVTRALAVRCSPGLRVNAVAPGLVDTPMTAAMPPRVLEKLVAKIPAGRSGRAEEIAAAVAFLASEEASYVNGQVLLVCGGRSVAG
jgi:NAD(P)-dependent dehydrogenase (short-subunit alcohol dehydrogenase family)